MAPAIWGLRAETASCELRRSGEQGFLSIRELPSCGTAPAVASQGTVLLAKALNSLAS